MYTLKLTTQSLQKQNNFSKKYLLRIKHFFKNKNILISGNIQKKIKNKKYTVLKSPHVNKKSREHFNFHTYKQTFYILDKNLNNLINFLIIFKKIIPKNLLLAIQIIKN